MALTKPTDKIIWANAGGTGPKYGQNNLIQPVTEKVNSGFLEDEIPPRNHFNWLLNNIHLWIDFMDTFFQVGTGSPEGVVTADIGTLYVDTNGGAGTTLYVKEANNGSANGWVSK